MDSLDKFAYYIRSTNLKVAARKDGAWIMRARTWKCVRPRPLAFHSHNGVPRLRRYIL